MLWRLVTTVQALEKPPDFSYDLFVVALQSLLELWLGLIAANFPTIAPLFPLLLHPRVKQYFASSAASNNKGGAVRGALTTFGSSGRNGKRKDFNLLTNDESQELEEYNYKPDGISRRMDIEVSVEPVPKTSVSKATTEWDQGRC